MQRSNPTVAFCSTSLILSLSLPPGAFASRRPDQEFVLIAAGVAMVDEAPIQRYNIGHETGIQLIVRAAKEVRDRARLSSPNTTRAALGLPPPRNEDPLAASTASVAAGESESESLRLPARSAVAVGVTAIEDVVDHVAAALGDLASLLPGALAGAALALYSDRVPSHRLSGGLPDVRLEFGSLPPLLMACAAGHVNVVQFAIEGVGLSPANGPAGVSEWREQAGGYKEDRVADGLGAIHVAAFFGRVEVVDLLLRHTHGLAALDMDSDGRSAGLWAALGGHFECIDAVARFGLEVSESVDQHGRGILHYAGECVWRARGEVRAGVVLFQQLTKPSYHFFCMRLPRSPASDGRPRGSN